jgi:hypothetical protein
MIAIKGFYYFLPTSTPHAGGYFIECLFMNGTQAGQRLLVN